MSGTEYHIVNVQRFAVRGKDKRLEFCYSFLRRCAPNHMDLIQIGKFIAKLRKEQVLTQEQLGEKIGVTNKTVSRWETGVYLPPADAMLALGKLFNVSVNEILSGKRLTDSEYKEAAEENLTQAIKVSIFSSKDETEFFKRSG